MKKRIAVFPGSFDPPSYGHLDIIKRATKSFDLLYVAIAENVSKQNKGIFTQTERKKLLKQLTKKYNQVEVVHFSGLITDFAKKVSADVLVRGLRVFSDFEYEFRMALANRKLSKIETLFLMSDEKYASINSTLIREIAFFEGKLSQFVPPEVEKILKKKIKK